MPWQEDEASLQRFLDLEDFHVAVPVTKVALSPRVLPEVFTVAHRCCIFQGGECSAD